jgi:hypothetical protein
MSLGGTTESGAVYNLAPGAGEFANLGFGFAHLPVVANVAVGPGAGDGMMVSIDDFPRMGLESIALTMGLVSREPMTVEEIPPALVTLPTSCAVPLSTTIEGESWGAEAVSLSVSFPQMTGCELLSFEPVIHVVPEVRQAGAPSGYELEIETPQHDEQSELATAQMQRALVMFPAGVSLGPSGMEGVVGCSEAEFELTSPGSGMCPFASRVGTVDLQAPLLGEVLSGSIYVAEAGTGPSGAPMALYLEAEGEQTGVLKLAGQLTQNPATGRLALSLNDIPQLPLSRIKLTFYGGSRALLANPPICGTFTTNSELMPWSDGLDAMPSSSFQITEGTGGGPCPSTIPPTTLRSTGQSAQPSTESSTGSSGGGGESPSAGDVGPEISLVSHGISGDHLLLRFTTSDNGFVTIAGQGVRTYMQSLRAGIHEVVITLTKRGVFNWRHHRLLELRLTLKLVSGLVSRKDIHMQKAQAARRR